LAARLCDEAKDRQIIISRNVYAEIEDRVEVQPAPDLELKGISRPVDAFSVVRIHETVSQPQTT
jgi:class 3 adenylate cyclase